MANYCANSILGNDANSGAYNPAVPDDWSNAKKTVGAMVTVMASGDTGYLTGYFNEAVSLTKGNSSTLSLRGVGLAIIDASGLASSYAVSWSGSSDTRNFYDLILRNPNGAGITSSYAGDSPDYVNVYRCHIEALTYGVNLEMRFSYSAVDGSLIVADTPVIGSHSGGNVIVRNGSTLIGTTNGIQTSSSAYAISITDALISAPVLLLLPNVTGECNYNCLDFSGANKTTIGGVNYDTLALHQAGTGLDLNSLDSTPAAECVDTTRSLYGLRPTSQLLRRGSAGRDIGWGGAMLAVSPGINADVYDHPYVVSGALVKDGSGYWVRDAVSTAVARFGDPTGLLLSDLGAARNVGQLLLEGTETFHMSQFDQAAGVGPYLTVRYKLSATQDALSDGTGWTVLKRHGRIDVATYRYFGLEVTWMGP